MLRKLLTTCQKRKTEPSIAPEIEETKGDVHDLSENENNTTEKITDAPVDGPYLTTNVEVFSPGNASLPDEEHNKDPAVNCWLADGTEDRASESDPTDESYRFMLPRPSQEALITGDETVETESTKSYQLDDDDTTRTPVLQYQQNQYQDAKLRERDDSLQRFKPLTPDDQKWNQALPPNVLPPGVAPPQIAAPLQPQTSETDSALQRTNRMTREDRVVAVLLRPTPNTHKLQLPTLKPLPH